MKNEIKETEKEAYIVLLSFLTSGAWPQITSAALFQFAHQMETWETLGEQDDTGCSVGTIL